MTVLFGIGLLLRLTPIATGNVYFGFDQALDTILTKILVDDHRLSLVSRYSGLQGVLMGPLWTWILALPYAVSRGHPAAPAIFLSLFSLFSSLFSFVFIRRHFGAAAAVLTALITLTAPIFIFNATVPASPHPLTFLFIFFFYAAYRLFFENKKTHWLTVLFLAGLFFQFEIGFALFLLPAIVILLLVSSRRRQLLSRHLFVGALLFAATFLPQVLFDLRHDFLITQGLWRLVSGQGNSLYSATVPLLTRAGERLWSFGDDFLVMTGLVRHCLPVGLAILVMVSGWYLALKNKARPYSHFLKLLFTILLSFYVGLTLYPGPIWVWYRAGLPIVYTLLLVLPAGYLWEKHSPARLLLAALFIANLLANINGGKIVSQWRGAPDPDVANLKLQKMVLDHIYQDAAGQPFSVFAYTPPVYDYLWQYDFYWYGRQRYGYLPRNANLSVPLLGIGIQTPPPTENEGLFYLIIEPNFERPWEIEGWKRNFVKFGEITEARSFPGNIHVEKRFAAVKAVNPPTKEKAIKSIPVSSGPVSGIAE